MTNDDAAQAGDVSSAKEDLVHEPGSKPRRAKLSRRSLNKPDEETSAAATETVAVQGDENNANDDFYYDALLRFGIQI